MIFNNYSLIAKQTAVFITRLSVCLLLSLPLASVGQTGKYPVKKIYAYQQKIRTGVNTSRERTRKEDTRTMIFLEIWKERKIEVTHLWEYGKQSGFRTELTATPVNIEGSGFTRTLVHSTSNEVLQIFHAEELSEKKTCPKAYRRYQVMIRYKEGNNIYYLGTFTRRLPDERRQ